MYVIPALFNVYVILSTNKFKFDFQNIRILIRDNLVLDFNVVYGFICGYLLINNLASRFVCLSHFVVDSRFEAI